jgi:glycerol kinase
MEKFILALDQGTTGNRGLVFDHAGRIRGQAYREFPQIYPQPGWIEHDAERIWRECRDLMNLAVADAEIDARQVAAVGITNQRETIVCWDRLSGRPVGNAIVWQDRRTSELCDRLRRDGIEPLVREKTGLVVDPYFSATKIKWMLDRDPSVRQRADAGDLLVGTMDCYHEFVERNFTLPKGE